MKTSPDSTPVVFRKWPSGDILALFPAMDEGRGLCGSYLHIGQHGSADYQHCVKHTFPATSADYADLMAELVSIGYDNLKVYRRWWAGR